MTKETMNKILENPQSYSANERLSAARLALAFLDLLGMDDRPLKYNQSLDSDGKKPPQVS